MEEGEEHLTKQKRCFFSTPNLRSKARQNQECLKSLVFQQREFSYLTLLQEWTRQGKLELQSITFRKGLVIGAGAREQP